MRPPVEKVLCLEAASAAVREARRLTRGDLQKLVDQFSWWFLTRRCCFSIFGCIYKLTAGEKTSELVTWDDESCAELETAEMVLPLLEVDLASPWLGYAIQTDASESAGAMVASPALAAWMHEESRWAARGGWTCFTGDAEELRRREISLVPEFETPHEAREIRLDALNQGKTVKSFRMVHLFSGHRRHGDLADWWEIHGARCHSESLAWSVDLGLDPADYWPTCLQWRRLRRR
jgi:hypothetical protein